ncbi:pantothenate kinase [Hydrococcus rivularis NIES-593]|uniref:Type III pantothenate kinase n=1 Tax=Hydrococcus rivularis NIES-593 TaxID=1921803 RepID=A0A1U7HF30_9CYAN|nr:pantothenate kinase [Hydrococcus rivularis]OKH22169.1 pantothenate kinase [Hydrococcus rivularis NIES-593]
MTKNSSKQFDWLGLIIGNSRLHWAWFQGEKLSQCWDSEHLSDNVVNEEFLKKTLPSFERDRICDLPIYIASVVPSQTALWRAYPNVKLITLERIPLKGIYPTMGIDRALAVWGAGTTLGFPCLVIDAGTALTFTGANSNRVLVGGAILPGLRLQWQSLATKTAALPEVKFPERLPNRWTLNTSDAIQSGVIYTILAGIRDFIEDWLEQFPNSQIALTGGDAKILLSYLQIQFPNLVQAVKLDFNLIFWGMRSLVFSQQ